MNFVYALLLLSCVIIPVAECARQDQFDLEARLSQVAVELKEMQREAGGNNEQIRLIQMVVHGVLHRTESDPTPFTLTSLDGAQDSGGLAGSAVGIVLRLVATLLAGHGGICGNSKGVYMGAEEGLLGFVFKLIKG